MADFGISSLIPHADMLKSDLEIGTTTGESVIKASIFLSFSFLTRTSTSAIVFLKLNTVVNKRDLLPYIRKPLKFYSLSLRSIN